MEDKMLIHKICKYVGLFVLSQLIILLIFNTIPLGGEWVHKEEIQALISGR